ncbi:hypothetical protein BPUTEOMOX_2716 [methanotrophic endosymbiont of Bathymodiolus puteoserpentis (Logatchev)]|nr:hypothetical protein BPUTEOMOX_2716 [methanotrophic endosymbiont of Bathymodiolus puteoserpentis (Logatchev)]
MASQSIMNISLWLDFFQHFFWRPLLYRLPRKLAFKLAGAVNLKLALRFQREEVSAYHQHLQVFYSVDKITAWHWCCWNFRMLGREALDAYFLQRVNQAADLDWVSLDEQCRTSFSALKTVDNGAIIIMAHYGRPILLSSYLGLHGCPVGMLSQPVDESNPHLNSAMRSFLQFKMRETVRLAGGRWLTLNDSPLALARAIKAGQRMIIMLDLSEPDPTRQITVPFGHGQLLLPPGIVRLAKQTNAKLFYACAEDHGCRSVCRVTALSDSPDEAFAQAVSIFENDCQAMPWEWWQWSNLPSLWSADNRP